MATIRAYPSKVRITSKRGRGLRSLEIEGVRIPFVRHYSVSHERGCQIVTLAFEADVEMVCEDPSQPSPPTKQEG